MATNTALEKTYDPATAARALGLGVSTIYGLLTKGRIRARVEAVSKYTITETALREFRENRKGNGHAIKKPTAKK